MTNVIPRQLFKCHSDKMRRQHKTITWIDQSRISRNTDKFEFRGRHKIFFKYTETVACIVDRLNVAVYLLKMNRRVLDVYGRNYRNNTAESRWRRKTDEWRCVRLLELQWESQPTTKCMISFTRMVCEGRMFERCWTMTKNAIEQCLAMFNCNPPDFFADLWQCTKLE